MEMLRDQFRVPWTRILHFAFDGNPGNPYLPTNFLQNAVVYTGTHDNATTREWYDELPGYQRQNLWSYLERTPGESPETAPALIDLAWSTAGSTDDGSISGSAQSGQGNSYERARSCRRELALALHRRHAVAPGP